MSVSPSLSQLHAKCKGVAVTAVLLTLLFATLPFSVPFATASAASSVQDNYSLMSSIKEESPVQTSIALKVQPSLVGVGQITWITATTTPLPPTQNDRINGLKFSILQPDGTNLTLGPFYADSTGFLTTPFVPTRMGQYIIQVTYDGQFFPNSNVTYLPSQSSIGTLNVQAEPVGPKTWTVGYDTPADFTTLQSAIDAASSGDTVSVRSGTYCENLVINKPLTLIGEAKNQTIIIGKVTGKTVAIAASQVTITNFTIQGVGGSPFQPNNVVVCFVNQNSYGNNISSNIITGDGYGIVLAGSNHNVDSNIVTSNGFSGIYLNGSSRNAISRNNVTGGKSGICIAWPSTNNVLRNNTLTGENLNLHIISYDLPGFTNDIDTSNTVNGKPICYWVGKTNQTVPLDAAAVYLVNCADITVQDLPLATNGQGILIAYTTNSIVQRNNITKCDNGIRIQSSSNITVMGNNIYSCSVGIALYNSANNNTVRNNTVSANTLHGLFVFQCTGNQFYHNILNNTKQFWADNLTNTWDNGYPSGGNYWSDYHGTDANGDGIGDTAYLISDTCADRYPLMSPTMSVFNVSERVTSSNTTTPAEPQTENTSVSQSNQTVTSEQKASINWGTSPINEDPQSTQEGAEQEPPAQTNYSVTAALIPIAVLLGTAVAIAFGGPLYLLRRKR